ncbi:MAG: tetratricopeptide repeat protein [Acidobacteriota bacterium]
MRKGLLVIALLAIAAGAVCAAVGYMLWREPGEWTTRSPKALEEFAEGLADLAKMYRMDAVRHFEEALELDPAFAMAKLHLALLYPSRSERRRMTEELREVDPTGLNDRERFLLSYQLAREEGRSGDAKAVLGSFLGEHPNDPFGIRVECEVAWEAQDWEAAERCYSNLLVLHPNWVEARNNLGYLAMARGDFAEAEERFETYLYLAPDQATPYHSRSVLMTVVGRYPEAREAIDKVIELKPDFCAAYTQKGEIGLMSGQLELADEAAKEIEAIEECQPLVERGAVCSLRAWRRYLAGDLEGAWQVLDGVCLERREGFDLLAHRMATMTDRPERATEIEEVLRHYQEKVEASGMPVDAKILTAISAHMAGVRALAVDDLALATERFAEADSMLGYWGGERASIKMFNRLNLLRALDLTGQTKRASALRREIDAVNPQLVETFPLPDVDALQRLGSAGLSASFPLREERHQ